MPGDTDPVGDLDTLELELVLADLASVEGRLDRQQRARQGRQVARGRDRRARAGGGACSATASRSTGPTSPTTSASCSRPRSCSPTSRCSSSSTSARTSSTRPTTLVAPMSTAERPTTCSRCACSSRPRPPQLDPEARRELLDGLGLGEGVVPRVARAALPPARPAHVPHDRRHRVACVDVPRRRQGARVRRRDPLRPAARLHPRRGDRLAGAARRSARGRRPRNRASCGSRGRTTRSSTATCSRSASTCDGVVMVWLVRDGDVLAPRRDRRTAARPRRKGLLGRDAVDGALVLRPVPPRPHRRDAVPDRRRVLRRRAASCCARATLAPWRLSPVVRRAAFVVEAEAGAFERWRLARGRPDRAARMIDASGPAERPAGALVLVATPIGNLGDLSPRAVEALRDADVIAAEDTRRTRALLTHAEIPAAGRLRAVHAHNEQERAASVVDAVRAGKRVAYVTDAGMPGISDPGRAARARLPRRRARGGGGARARARCSPRWCSRASRPSGSCSRASCRDVVATHASGIGVARHRRPHDGAVRVAPAGARDARRAAATVCGPLREVAVARELTKLLRGGVARHARRRRRPRRRSRDAAGRARDRRSGPRPRRRRRATTRSTRTCAPRSPRGCRHATPPRGSPRDLGVPRRRAYDAAIRLRKR